MKKLLFAMLLILATFSTKAQIWQGGIKTLGELNFNPKKTVAVPNVALVSKFSTSYGLNYKFYYNANSYYSHNINGVSAELLYSNNIQTYKRTDTADVYSSCSFKNLEIPVLWSSKNQDWGLYGEFGFSYLRTLNKSQSNKEMIPLDFYSNNFNAIAGAGFDNELTRDIVLTVGLRAYYPILDMTRNTGYKSTHILRTGMVLGVSYYFNYYHHNMH